MSSDSFQFSVTKNMCFYVNGAQSVFLCQWTPKVWKCVVPSEREKQKLEFTKMFAVNEYTLKDLHKFKIISKIADL